MRLDKEILRLERALLWGKDPWNPGEEIDIWISIDERYEINRRNPFKPTKIVCEGHYYLSETKNRSEALSYRLEKNMKTGEIEIELTEKGVSKKLRFDGKARFEVSEPYINQQHL